MKNRWILGLLLPLTACGNKGGSSNAGSGGSAPISTGGSNTNASSGGVTSSSGGSTNASGGSSSNSGGANNSSQGGSSQGGGSSGNRGGTANSSSGGSNSGGGTQSDGQGGSMAGGGSGNAGSTGLGSASVLERNGGPTREATWVQPTLTKAASAKMALETGFNATFSGSMFASPLFVENGPNGKGVFIVASTDNVVAALDEATGNTVWTKTLGSAPGVKGQACSAGRDPVGILGTPVIDAKTGTIYVGVPSGTNGVEKHEVYALSLMDGSVRSGWPVNVSAMKAGSLAFNTKYQNQRSALALVNGIVYVAYGGFNGDCNDYRGWVIAIDTTDPTKTGAFATAGAQEAIWASGGFASDGTNIFPVTGNGKATSRDQSDSEAILKMTGLAQFQRTDANTFYPAAWKSMDSADTDLGGSNSLLVKIPGTGMPDRALVAVGKDGMVYLVNPNNLGGSDGQIAALQIATPSSPAILGVRTSPTAYTTANGTYLAMSVGSAPDCPNAVTGAAVVGVKITGGSPPKAEVAWCAPGGNPAEVAPISTTTDGKTDAVVWYVNSGQLKGVDGDTGAAVFPPAQNAPTDGGGSCLGQQRWTSPLAVKGRIVTGANGKLCSWRPSM